MLSEVVREDSDCEDEEDPNQTSSCIDSATTSRRNFLAMERYGLNIVSTASTVGLMLVAEKQSCSCSRNMFKPILCGLNIFWCCFEDFQFPTSSEDI